MEEKINQLKTFLKECPLISKFKTSKYPKRTIFEIKTKNLVSVVNINSEYAKSNNELISCWWDDRDEAFEFHVRIPDYSELASNLKQKELELKAAQKCLNDAKNKLFEAQKRKLKLKKDFKEE